MMLYRRLHLKLQKMFSVIRYHTIETDDVFIYWSDFRKGWFLLFFALLILPGHLFWYISNFFSENRIWFDESYYDERVFTTWFQILLTVLVTCIAFIFRKNSAFRRFMGWFIPLYFGLLLIYSAHTVGIYSPAAMGGTLNILLIGFVFYKPKVIYSIMLIIATVFVCLCYYTYKGVVPYAPLFSDRLNNDNLWQNEFWLNSMAILYLPILFVSALFFEILLRQWRRREKKIETLSQTDSLTNVYNRRYTTDFITQLNKKDNRNYAMIILDLDYFKKVNDDYGHDVGDEVLRQVAKVLQRITREQDIAGRLGGEEFVLILPDLQLSDAMMIAERCRKEIENLSIELEDGQSLKITASFGIAISADDMRMDDVSRLADKALYLSKQKGRNTVSHYLE